MSVNGLQLTDLAVFIGGVILSGIGIAVTRHNEKAWREEYIGAALTITGVSAVLIAVLGAVVVVVILLVRVL